ncbi:unnamed protein product [Candida verbasci]|uniref:Uncharacterized protein n=1 Tax=Candida verbasci TaxID=1227364 RepID=A0A9W4XGQ6_9ASCO|nr:unnamed protein product [Candida verbasci]
MGKSFYAIEQEKIKSIIEIPLLELVLTFLPHLQPNQTLINDTWEIIAIKLNNTRFKDLIATTEKTIDDIESLPELNGVYLKDYYDELYSKFKGRLIFKLTYRPNEPAHNKRDTLIWKTKSDAILYELSKIEYANFEIMSTLARERLEEAYRLDYKESYIENDKLHEEEETKEEIFDSKETLENYKTLALKEKNQLLLKEIEKKDKKMNQINTENERLLSLNHQLLEQMK